ncbi:MAG: hormogonium polysaccharide secretion pseudopilin HpsB [Coleofasciculus sp. B1-GNL1-01]|uniref:hormogonium polysaccharide secretion pseudopilin HpsB n=1 Tax=Coleofasciculus sp. B1-GNL1-01 TaxID=3068484 RepID=UPI0032FB66B9
MLKPPNHPPSSSSQSGFTIIESLIAIIVVSILMIGLSPVIVLSVATRVQARRVELATQAARDYVDGVRSGAIDPPGNTVNVGDKNKNLSKFADEAAPNTTLPTCNTNAGQYCSDDPNTGLYCVDRDESGGCENNSAKDMIVQAFRSVYEDGNGDVVNDSEKGYLLGIRVYRADGFQNDGNLETGQTQLASTSGLRVSDRKDPLFKLTTEIPPPIQANPADADSAYQDFCDRLGGCVN